LAAEKSMAKSTPTSIAAINYRQRKSTKICTILTAISIICVNYGGFFLQCPGHRSWFLNSVHWYAGIISLFCVHCIAQCADVKWTVIFLSFRTTAISPRKQEWCPTGRGQLHLHYKVLIVGPSMHVHFLLFCNKRKQNKLFYDCLKMRFKCFKRSLRSPSECYVHM